MKEYGFLNNHIIYEYLSTYPNLSLNPLVIGYERCKSNKGVTGLRKNCYILQFVISGCGTLSVRGKTYKIEKNSLMLLPMEEVSYAPDKDDPWSYIWIEFTGSQANSLLSGVGLDADSPVFVPQNAEEIYELFADMIEGIYRAKRQDCYGLYCAATLMKIFYFVALQTHAEETAPMTEESKITPVIQFIQEHYAEPDFTVQKVCDHFFWSPSYLTRIFKKIMNIPPMKYVVQLRMEKAQKMLDSHSFTIAAIAYACGYNSPYYFTLEFKRYVGTPPSKYQAKKVEPS